jgi:hypothetical protein
MTPAPPAPTPSPTPPPTPTATPTPTPTCPFTGSSDLETLENLVHAEAEAVNTKNIEIIKTIFAPSALISDAVRGESSTDPVARYQDQFARLDFKEVQHTAPEPIGPGIQADVAYFTSGNTGYWRFIGGEWNWFENTPRSDPDTPFGSDHWTFSKNGRGCWIITKFEFNAGHVPFPP